MAVADDKRRAIETLQRNPRATRLIMRRDPRTTGPVSLTVAEFFESPACRMSMQANARRCQDTGPLGVGPRERRPNHRQRIFQWKL
jgi:hypothetical protein